MVYVLHNQHCYLTPQNSREALKSAQVAGWSSDYASANFGTEISKRNKETIAVLLAASDAVAIIQERTRFRIANMFDARAKEKEPEVQLFGMKTEVLPCSNGDRDFMGLFNKDDIYEDRIGCRM